MHLFTLIDTNTHGGTPLDGRSACCLDPYLTTHNTHKRQVAISVAGFDPQSLQATDLRLRGHGDLRVCLLYLYFVPAVASSAGPSRFCAVCRITANGCSFISMPFVYISFSSLIGKYAFVGSSCFFVRLCAYI